MIYSFGDATLDTGAHRLHRQGADVHLEPQVFDLIALLAARAPELVTYDEIVETVWKGRIVSDATIAARISAARTALGDDGRRQSVIRTHVKRGLQIALAVTQSGEPAPHGAPTGSGAVMPGRQTGFDVRLAQSADGTSIAWSATGDGPPVVRAGHWLTHLSRDLDSPLWAPWIAHLSRDRRLVRYDPRGTGMSGAECGALALARSVEDLEAVFDAAGLERAAIFAASQSAAAAFTFAARHPQRVSRIVTWGAFVQGSRMRSGGEDGTMTDAISTMIRQGWGQPRSSYARMLAALFMPEASPGMVDHLLSLQMASADAERAVEIREMCSRYDVVDILPKVTCPILAAHGTGDSTHPISQSRLIATRAPDARLLSIETNNHVLAPDEPGFPVLMAAMDAFLAEERSP